MRQLMIILILILGYFVAISQQTKPIVKFRHCNTCTSAENQDDPIINPTNPNGLFDYLQITNYETFDVESDFDMRNPGSVGTKFHEGIDYANYATYLPNNTNICTSGGNNNPVAGTKDKPMGDAILSVEGGVITNISGGNGLKFVRIRTNDNLREYSYLHIFHTIANKADNDGKLYQKCGNFILKQVDFGTNWSIINLATGIAYSSDYPSVKVTFNNVQYNTKNWVGQYEEFAPIGDAIGSGSNIDAHLHLNLYYNEIVNNKIKSTIQSDPWCEVEHIRTYFDEEIVFNQDVPTNQNLQSSSLNTTLKYSLDSKNSIRFRCKMCNDVNGTCTSLKAFDFDNSRYSNVVMNEAEIKLLIKKNYQKDFYLIQGAALESRFNL